jgi:hypothetical protein
MTLKHPDKTKGRKITQRSLISDLETIVRQAEMYVLDQKVCGFNPQYNAQNPRTIAYMKSVRDAVANAGKNFFDEQAIQETANISTILKQGLRDPTLCKLVLTATNNTIKFLRERQYQRLSERSQREYDSIYSEIEQLEHIKKDPKESELYRDLPDLAMHENDEESKIRHEKGMSISLDETPTPEKLSEDINDAIAIYDPDRPNMHYADSPLFHIRTAIGYGKIDLALEGLNTLADKILYSTSPFRTDRVTNEERIRATGITRQKRQELISELEGLDIKLSIALVDLEASELAPPAEMPEQLREEIAAEQLQAATELLERYELQQFPHDIRPINILTMVASYGNAQAALDTSKKLRAMLKNQITADEVIRQIESIIEDGAEVTTRYENLPVVHHTDDDKNPRVRTGSRYTIRPETQVVVAGSLEKYAEKSHQRTDLEIIDSPETNEQWVCIHDITFYGKLKNGGGHTYRTRTDQTKIHEIRQGSYVDIREIIDYKSASVKTEAEDEEGQLHKVHAEINPQD